MMRVIGDSVQLKAINVTQFPVILPQFAEKVLTASWPIVTERENRA